MQGKRDSFIKPLKLKTRVCRRCNILFQSTAKRGAFCEPCKKPSGSSQRFLMFKNKKT